jgi:hypothetical protein
MHAFCDNEQKHSANSQLHGHKCMIQKTIEVTYEAQQQSCGNV